MQEIPAIIENSIAPFSPSFIAAPIKIPTIPAMIIMISDTTVLNFFMFTLLSTRGTHTTKPTAEPSGRFCNLISILLCVFPVMPDVLDIVVILEHVEHFLHVLDIVLIGELDITVLRDHLNLR